MTTSRKRSILRQHGGHISEVVRIGPEVEPPPAREEWEVEEEQQREAAGQEQARERAAARGQRGRSAKQTAPGISAHLCVHTRQPRTAGDC